MFWSVGIMNLSPECQQPLVDRAVHRQHSYRIIRSLESEMAELLHLRCLLRLYLDMNALFNLLPVLRQSVIVELMQ
jgi:hypothetical protein